MVSVLKNKNKVLCIYSANNLESLVYVRHFARCIVGRDEWDMVLFSKSLGFSWENAINRKINRWVISNLASAVADGDRAHALTETEGGQDSLSAC